MRQTLKHSVKLKVDLTNCPGDGVIIGADGITVDLNGHTIDGVPKSGCDRPQVIRGGVTNEGGFDGVTIKNGTVRQFDAGVNAGSQTAGMSDGTVRGLVARDNRFGGISLGSGAVAAATARNRVDHNTVSGSPCGDGLKLNVGEANRFAHNRVTNVGTGITIRCDASRVRNVVVHNRITRTAGVGVLVFSTRNSRIDANVLRDIGGGGIDIVSSSNGVIKDNRLTRVHGAGINVVACDDCNGPPEIPTNVRIAGNKLDRTGDGITLTNTDRDVVRDNSVIGAGKFGDREGFGVGIALDGVSDTVIRSNTIADSGRGPGSGILIGIPAEFDPSRRPVTGNKVVRKRVTSQTGDGIFAPSTAQETTLERNSTDRNAADGIHVASAATTLVRNSANRNSANRNAAYGIEAVVGVTDGGGNRAKGNGTAAQCAGVACK